MNIMNKFFKSNKNYYVDLTIDNDKMIKNIECMTDIIKLPENKIWTYKGIEVSTIKNSVKFVFGTRRDRDIFALGCKKYIDYRCMSTNC